ncbi:hypothetical protein RhiirA1_472434 [Rhizophagus irregularis]|uniref:Uncharacterized protein n=1 Tax=Rhizophagus irregularis TaxID=588596 RepID=A0A2N0R2E6_9GLOM|nr:hypothetical protein RhiirA1_472434 [Rhizophagus irregularis]
MSLCKHHVEAENVGLKQIIEENARRDAENAELKSRVRELEARLALLEQRFHLTNSTMKLVTLMVMRKWSISWMMCIRKALAIRRQEKKQRDQKALASSESIRSASCVLSKQPQVNASKLTCNLETREDSSRLESCDMEELKSDQHDEDPSSDTAQNIVCMFKKAKKLGQEAILYWYYFIEKYDKRIDNLIAGGVKKKTATSMVYQEIKQLLLEITDVNLHQKNS